MLPSVDGSAPEDAGQPQEKLAWTSPVLERLSMKATETTNVVLSLTDGPTNYS